MTGLGTCIAALVTAGAAAVGGVVGAGDGSARGTALVIDASAARDGRDLVDERLEALDAELRLPRTAAEARTNVRYFAEQGHRVVVAGPVSGAAADTAGVNAVQAAGLTGAVAAARQARR